VKASHKKIIDELNAGHWLTSETHKTWKLMAPMIGSMPYPWPFRNVQRRVIDEMVSIGLLVIGIRDNRTAYVPASSK